MGQKSLRLSGIRIGILIALLFGGARVFAAADGTAGPSEGSDQLAQELDKPEPAKPAELELKSEPAKAEEKPKEASKKNEASGTEEDSKAKRGYGKTSGILGPILIGPKVTLIGAPMIIRAGLETKFFNWAGVAFDYGIIPTVTYQGVDVSAYASQFSARFYPFRGRFFVGAGFGQQNLKGKKSQVIQGVPVNVEVNVKSNIVTPQIGWRWVWESGWFMGMELGWQIASSPETTITTDAPAIVTSTSDYISAYNDVKKIGDQVGSSGLPHLALIQFGFFF